MFPDNRWNSSLRFIVIVPVRSPSAVCFITALILFIALAIPIARSEPTITAIIQHAIIVTIVYIFISFAFSIITFLGTIAQT